MTSKLFRRKKADQNKCLYREEKDCIRKHQTRILSANLSLDRTNAVILPVFSPSLIVYMLAASCSPSYDSINSYSIFLVATVFLFISTGQCELSFECGQHARLYGCILICGQQKWILYCWINIPIYGIGGMTQGYFTKCSQSVMWVFLILQCFFSQLHRFAFVLFRGPLHNHINSLLLCHLLTTEANCFGLDDDHCGLPRLIVSFKWDDPPPHLLSITLSYCEKQFLGKCSP